MPWLLVDAGADPEGPPLQGGPVALLCADGSLHALDAGGGAVGFHVLPPIDGAPLVELTRGDGTAPRGGGARRGVLRRAGPAHRVGRRRAGPGARAHRRPARQRGALRGRRGRRLARGRRRRAWCWAEPSARPVRLGARRSASSTSWRSSTGCATSSARSATARRRCCGAAGERGPRRRVSRTRRAGRSMTVSPPPFQRFLDEHREDVWRFLVASVGREAADDCFQETFLAALRAYPRMRADEPARVGADDRPPQGARPPPRAQAPRGAGGEELPEVRRRRRARAARRRRLGPRRARCRPSSAPPCCCASPATSATARSPRRWACSEDAARRNAFEGLRKLRQEMTA